MVKPQDFKNTVFYVDSAAESEAVQKAMFALGFMWNGKRPGEKRKVYHWLTRGFIYVDSDCRMFHGQSGVTTIDGKRCQPVFQQALFAAAAEFKAEKKYKRKESRKKKSFVAVNPAELLRSPVPGNTEVEYVLRNGERSTCKASYLSWGSLPYWYDREIVAYRVVQKPVPAATVTLQQMVDGIVADAGGVEVQHVDKDGFIAWDGTNFYSSNVCWEKGGMHGPVLNGTRVDVKYKDGEIRYNLTVGQDTFASGAFWQKDGMDKDIVGYRLVPTVAHKEDDEPPTVYEPLPELGAQQVGEPVPADPALDPAANPKHAVGNTSLPMTGVSPLLRAMISLAKHNGALKYGLTNYIGTPVVMSTYLHAIQRHFDAILMGEEVDPVDGVPHWGAIGANLDIIVSARAAGTLIDDRPRQDGQLEAYRALTPLVASLNELHANRNPKHYYMKDAE